MVFNCLGLAGLKLKDPFLTSSLHLLVQPSYIHIVHAVWSAAKQLLGYRDAGTAECLEEVSDNGNTMSDSKSLGSVPMAP